MRNWIVHKASFTTHQGATFAFGACIVVLLWAGVIYKYFDDVSTSLVEAERDNTNLSLLLEENSLRAIEEIDKSLLYLRRSIEAQRGMTHLTSIVDASDLLSEIIVQVAVVDADGMMQASNAVEQPHGPIDLSDRPHYLFHKNNSADVLYISPPVIGRASGKWSVQFTRKLRTPDKQFGGVVVASLDPRHLTNLYDSMTYESSTSVALIGDDGIVRSSGGSQTIVFLGEDLSKQALFIRAREANGGTFQFVDPDTKNRILTTFRPVRGRPLWVSISRNLEKDFAEPLQTLWRNSIAAALVSILIIYVTIGIFGAERRVRNKAKQLRLTLDNMSEGIMLLAPDNAVQIINENCCKLLGFPTATVDTPDQLSGNMFQGIVHAARSEPPGGRVDGALAIANGGAIFERQMPDGKILEVRSNRMAGGGVVCTFTDITQRRQSEERIIRLASEDVLTGLPNRRSFVEALRRLLEPDTKSERTRAVDPFAVLFLDIDHFKNINDSLGHRIGDVLLIDIGKRMRSLLPPKALIARLGGDEFAILLPSISEVDEVDLCAAQIIQAVERPFDLDGYKISTSVSIGIAMGPTDASEVDALLAAADLALYSTKSEQRGIYKFYAPAMSSGLEERRWIETAFAAAIEADQLEIHYQPIMDLKSGTIAGFEALARWYHPERGAISPDKFIPVAEETGLITKFGTWVLRTACRRAAEWPNNFRVAVNVSPIQLLAPDMVAVVEQALAETGIDPSRLELEITERILIQEREQTRDLLSELKRLGVRIVLDDFGTGYSSLSYLRTFTFDKVKIDKSFISDLSLGTDRTVIIQAVISIANALGMQTTAEGVEVEYQRELLKALGCDQAQGYLFAKALAGQDVEAFIERWPSGLPKPKKAGTAQAAAERLRVS